MAVANFDAYSLAFKAVPRKLGSHLGSILVVWDLIVSSTISQSYVLVSSRSTSFVS